MIHSFTRSPEISYHGIYNYGIFISFCSYVNYIALRSAIYCFFLIGFFVDELLSLSPVSEGVVDLNPPDAINVISIYFLFATFLCYLPFFLSTPCHIICYTLCFNMASHSILLPTLFIGQLLNLYYVMR